LEEQVSAKEKARAELAEAQARLIEASRAAGMAEIATGVLHNVGNVLNSVNVSTTLVADRLRASRMNKLTRVAELLREHSSDLAHFLAQDPKGRILPEYVADLANHLAGEHETVRLEVESLARNIEHIKEIVAMQQNYARVSGLLETLAPAELVEDALRINAAALARHSVRIVREFDSVPPVQVDRHKVLQILVNLLSNAKYALGETPPGSRELRLGIHPVDGRHVRITVWDNGAGIAPENLTRVFQHGFTTRKNGHGFGLHSGANAARELGGSLTAQSEGLGQGATFVLELPAVAQGSTLL
jgi:C4-dicarboxylate-specific signal transduction histidine kinase